MKATVWKTEKLTTEGELHHQHASGLVPEEAFPLVTSLETQQKPRGGEGGGGMRNTGEKRDFFFLKVTNLMESKFPRPQILVPLFFYNQERGIFHPFSDLKKRKKSFHHELFKLKQIHIACGGN